MSSKLKYHKNYTEFGEPYQLVLPLSLEGLVPEDDSVRLLSHELEELDYSLLYQAYSARGRNPAVDPKTMFKILTYAYSQNIYSSRKIETACRRDINFMWLLAGQKAPDHSTIARFRTGFARGNKRLYLSKSFLEKRQESYENILSETGIKYRINRSIQVEGAFGVLKNDYGFQRFLLRGKTKVKLEILLLCLGLTSINYMKKYKKNGQEVICLQ